MLVLVTFIADSLHPSNWNRDERNLYVRVVAEFLYSQGPDRQQRGDLLFGCRNQLAHEQDLGLPASIPRPSGELVATFDNNLHDAVRSEQRGREYGDVVLWGNDGFVTIEAKCNTNWKFSKDVEEVFASGAQVAASTGRSHLAHVLIVAQQKWNHVRRPSAMRQKTSNMGRLKHYLSQQQPSKPLFVITWEQIAEAALSLPSETAGDFSAWLRLQVEICLRKVGSMPPFS